jgi:flagellar hook-basal body complex protein FliE
VIPPISGAIGPLGPAEWSVQPIVPPTAAGQATTDPNAVTGATGSGSGGFGGALANAISSLEQGQTTASTAAQQLATGQATDPTQAVMAVENASLQMQLASQIRTKLDEAATTIFQTQV